MNTDKLWMSIAPEDLRKAVEEASERQRQQHQDFLKQKGMTDESFRKLVEQVIEAQSQSLGKSDRPDERSVENREMAQRIALDLKSSRPFDIFFSYFHDDRAEVERAKQEIKGYGYTAYIDFEFDYDPQFDPKNITRETVNRLRQRLRQCRSLFFVISEKSLSSEWTPWELGYMDGFVGAERIFLYPLGDDIGPAISHQGFLKAYEGNVVDRNNLQSYLARHLPKTGNPVLDEPLLRLGDRLRTDDYRDWLKQNAPRLTSDPQSLMYFFCDIVQACSRLTSS